MPIAPNTVETTPDKPMRELVLTGLPELWPANEKTAVFLGPWCFAGHATYRFEQHVNFQMAPPLDLPTQEILRAAAYVDSLCDRMIPGMARLMNRLHAVRHSEQFWKIIIINWLLHWVGVCHERYQRFVRLREQYAPKEPLRVRVLRGAILHPKSWQQYNAWTAGHAYNLQLMSDILRESDEFGFLHQTVSDVAFGDSDVGLPRSGSGHTPSSPDARSKPALGRLLERLAASVLARTNTRCYLGNIYGIERLDKLRIQWATNPLRFFNWNRAFTGKHRRVAERSRLLALPFDFECRNAFERMLQRILPAHLPTSFLSYHSDGKRRPSRGTTWIGSELHGDIDRRYLVAHIVEGGGRWISVQHGGGYGQVRLIGNEKVEYETPGTFLTWGWSAPQGHKAAFEPLPSPILSKLARHEGGGNGLVLVGTMRPAYHYRFQIAPQPEHLLEYLTWKERFLRHTDESVRARLIYRPYMHDYGIDDVFHVRKVAPHCEILTAQRLSVALRRVKLAVIDHPATSFLEAFVMNVPTILFWSPTVYALSSNAQPYFDKLCAAGILFDTPEGAAQKVNDVWSNVTEWWCGKEIQETRASFCRQFALSCTHWRTTWTAFMKKLAR